MITKEDQKEYNQLAQLVKKSIKRMNEIDSKIPRNTFGGGNYPNKHLK